MSLSTAVRVGVPGKRWLPGQLGAGASAAAIGTGPVGGPEDPIGLKVEIFVNSAWTDISPFVYYRGGARVKITRGRPNETSQIQPQTCTLVINNRDGRFSPRNPTGPYYGQLGRNTPIRVSRLQNGIRRYRFHGEIPSWPTTWDISGTDVYAAITAAGQLRRLNQGAQPLKSTFYRVYGQGAVAVVTPAAYWPAEDGTKATAIASGLPGGTAMVLTGQSLPTFASNTSFVCSSALPLLSASIWTGSIPAATTTANVLRFLLSVPATGAFDGGVLARLYTSGTIARLDAVWIAASGGYIQLNGYNSAGATLFTTTLTPSTPGVTGKSVLVSIEVTASGGNITATVYYAQQPYIVGSFGVYFQMGAATIAGTIGQATQVVISPLGQFNDTAVGHVIVQASADSLNAVLQPFNAYLTEAPVTRFQRLCAEQNAPQAVSAASANAADPTTMGFQTATTFPALIQQCADTALALLYEARDQAALVLRTKGTLYNQAAKLTLDYSQNQLSGPLNPVDDDALTRNDVTVTRINGSSVQVQQTSGTLSIQPPPSGVGDYATTYSISLGADSLLPDQAGWRLHLGTVDQPRYPQIPINLRHSTFTSNVDLMNAALTIDIGDRLVVTNPPAWMPPDQISQILQGYTETLGIWEHDMVFNCSPEDPYRVGLLDDVVLGHLDTDGSMLAAAAGPTDTTLSVATTNPTSPPWTMNPNDFPFDVNIGGERMTVTAIGCTMAGADGTFESGVSGWTPTGATFVSNASTAYTGLKCGQLAVVGSPSFAQALTSFIPVAGGVTYRYSQFVEKVLGSGLVQCDIDWYTAGLVYISSSFSTDSTAGTAPNWAHQVLVATAPSNAAFAQVGPNITPPVAGDVINVDNVVFGPQVFTVTRSVNGVVKSQTAGTDVRLWQPLYLSM